METLVLWKQTKFKNGGKMKRQLVELISFVQERMNAAMQKLLDGRNTCKKCRCTIYKGLLKVVLTVRQLVLSEGYKNTRVFGVAMRVTGAVPTSHGKLKRVDAVGEFEKTYDVLAAAALN